MADEEHHTDLVSALKVEKLSFTCKHCGAVSYNPNDLIHMYCGKCRHFCSDVDLLADIFGPK